MTVEEILRIRINCYDVLITLLEYDQNLLDVGEKVGRGSVCTVSVAFIVRAALFTLEPSAYRSIILTFFELIFKSNH